MNFSENSRVWVYQSNRIFLPAEITRLENHLSDFTGSWEAHGHALQAGFEIRYSRFIILMVDESAAGATGCSIDRSVNLMKEIDEEFGVNMFDRFNIAYREGEGVLSCNRESFEELVASGKISEDTIVFNNLVHTKKELEEKWEVPYKDSWHGKVFGVLS